MLESAPTRFGTFILSPPFNQMPISLRELATGVAEQRPALLLRARASIPPGAPSGAELAKILARKLSPELMGKGYRFRQ